MLKSILSSVSAVAAVAAVIGFSSAPANAVPVDVTYQITQADYFSAAGGGNTLTLAAGPVSFLTIRFSNGTAGGHVGAGLLNVQSGDLYLDGNFTALAGALVFTGAQHVTFAGGPGLEGKVTAGGALDLGTSGVIASGFQHCSGAVCGLAGFTASVNVPLTGGPRNVRIGGGNAASTGVILGFPSVGPSTIQGMGLDIALGNTLTLTLVGSEIGRTVVPEPGTGLLLGLGLAGLGLSGGAFGARRRR